MKNLLILTLLLFSSILYSQPEYYGYEVVSFNQGLTNLGNQVLPIRSDSSKALGKPQNNDQQTSNSNFASLGFGGEIILKTEFPIAVTPNTTINVYETTWTYTNCDIYGESADIYVSNSLSDWFYIGRTCLNDNTSFSLYNTGLDSILYIKVVDVSVSSSFNQFNFESDGYDLDGIEIVEFGPLAIELKSFNVRYSNQNVEVEFVTSSETNTYKFYIQHSVDLQKFDNLFELDAAGFSSSDKRYYKSIIFNPKSDITYFRLVELDLNGVYHFYEVKSVYTTTSNVEYYYFDLLGRSVDSKSRYKIAVKY